MKKYFKNTKWWMYLPFAAIWMSHWMFEGGESDEMSNRYVFLMSNLIFTCYVGCFMAVEIIEIFHLLPHRHI